MSETHFQRSVLTDALLTALATTGKSVGDAEKPRANAGWTGDPNAEGTNFAPYVVLTPLVASQPTGPLADPQGDMVFPYAVSAFGVSRKQCEWMADAARASLTSLERTTVSMTDGTVTYNRYIQQVWQQQIGQTQRVSDVEPPYYSQTDVIHVWTSK